jgi:VWFA-related protein
VRIKQFLLLVLVCVLAVHMPQGQTAQSDEIKIASQPYIPEETGTIKVQSTIVDLTVIVRDANGKLVTGLKQSDFEVYDQGKKQTISAFNMELAHPPAIKVPEHVETTALPPAPPPPIPARFLGFYFDDQNMSASDMTFARKAAVGFIDKNMEETDRAGVFTSSTTVTQQFTSNKQQVKDTLGKLVSHQRATNFGSTSCPRITPYEAMQIVQMFDTHSDAFDLALAQAEQCNCLGAPDANCAAQQARLVQTQAATVLSLSEQFAGESLGVLGDVIRYMGRMPGRRMLIMCSSGFFSRTDKVQHAQDKMIDSALKAGIVINTLDTKGLAADWVGGNPADGPPNLTAYNGRMNALQDEFLSDERAVSNDSMAVLASATGGKFFQNSNDLGGGLVEIAALPEVTYALSFSPDDLKENGTYHNLKVRVPGMHDISISARPGYFAPSHERNSPSAKFQKLTKQVMLNDDLAEVGTEVTTQSGTNATGESALKVTVHVNGKSLSFKKENNNIRNERLIFITALFDMQNHYLGGNEALMEMNLKNETYTQISKDGVDAKTTLQAPPGTYRLREVVQEVVAGRLSASTHTVEIH